MQALRHRPLGSSNFLVEIGGASGRAPSAGFAEVIFPTFTFGVSTGGGTAGPPEGVGLGPGTPVSVGLGLGVGGAVVGGYGGASGAAPASQRLILRRGATGALDLYTWWDQARHAKAPRRRVVKVRLLADDHATVVMTWRFSNVRPLSLAYSPLQAMGKAILMESIELAFDAVEMSAA